MDFFDLFEDRKELARQTFAQPFHLIDLTRVGDDELTKYLWFGTMAIMLKHVHDTDILPLFKRHLQIFRKIEKEGEEEYLYTILSYVVEAAEVSSKEEFLQTVMQLESVNEEKVMTLVEQLKPEIYQRGIEKGKAEGIQEIARHMFNKGITVDLISEVTGLSIEDIRKASIN